jgi:hypothetical protein
MRYAEEARRLRLSRQAEGIATASAFAARVGWPQSGVSQFETGKRRVTVDKALMLRAMIPGFDPLWLWEGEKRGLSIDLKTPNRGGRSQGKTSPGHWSDFSALNAVQNSMNEIGRAIFALGVTALVCIATYFIIRYLMAA